MRGRCDSQRPSSHGFRPARSRSPAASCTATSPDMDRFTMPSDHICVCICTYRRPTFLTALLQALADQETEGQFTYSVVVVDNDRARSAEAVVRDFTASTTLAVY